VLRRRLRVKTRVLCTGPTGGSAVTGRTRDCGIMTQFGENQIFRRLYNDVLNTRSDERPWVGVSCVYDNIILLYLIILCIDGHCHNIIIVAESSSSRAARWEMQFFSPLTDRYFFLSRLRRPTWRRALI